MVHVNRINFLMGKSYVSVELNGDYESIEQAEAYARENLSDMADNAQLESVVFVA